jgi:hypothetical protein
MYPPGAFVSMDDADGVNRNLCSHPSLKRLPGSFPRRIFGTSRPAPGRTASSSSSIKHGGTEDDGAAWQFAETEPNKRLSENVLKGEKDTDGTGGIRGEIVLLGNPDHWTVCAVDLGGGLHGARVPSLRVGPEYLAGEIDGIDLKIIGG